MPEFGHFQIIAPLKLTDHGSVNVATRLGDGQRRYALKVFPVPADAPRNAAEAGDDDEEISPRWEAQYFLDHARVQQKLIASGATHWATVHDLGMTPAGAYVVLDYCPRSVQTLLDEKTILTIADLHALAAGVLAGLAEIKHLRGRSHGHLKPANVLIEGSGDLAAARILLTDPGSPAVAARTGEDGDLRALGEMLRALVVGAAGGGASAAWDRLGPSRDRWQAYIGALLGAQRGTAICTLSAAQAALPRGVADRPMAPGFRMAIMAVVALGVIVAAIVGISLAINASQWKHYQQTRSEWLSNLVTDSRGDARRARWQSDPQLRDALDQIVNGHLDDQDDSSKSALVISPAVYFRRRTQFAAAAVVAADLAPDHWQRLGHLSELETQFRARGWTQPADVLADVIKNASPPSAKANFIDRVLDLNPAIDQSLPPIDAAWKQLASVTNNLTATGSPMLKAFAAHLLSGAAASVQLDAGGLSVRDDALATRLALARQLDHATRDASVDGARFASALANRIDVARVNDADVKTYLDTIAQYSVQRDAIASATDTLRKALADMSQTIASSRPKEAEAAALAADRAKVEVQIKTFADTPFIAGDITNGSFARQQQAIEAKIDGLNKYSHPESAAEWIASLTAPPVGSPALLTAWQTRLQSLRSQASALDHDRLAFLDVKAATNRFRASLAELDRSFPRPPSQLTPTFAAAATARREMALQQSLSDIDAQTGRLDSSSAQSTSARFSSWLQQLALLNADFPLRQPILTPADRPDLTWAKKADFWGDSLVTKLVTPDLARINELATVASADRPRLISDLASPKLEIALAAWQRLGDSGNPAWPTQAGELQTEADGEQHLQSLLSAMHDSVAEAAVKELHRQSATRWQRFADAARSDQAIQNALALAPTFGISRKNFDQLPWPTNFDFWLAATRNSARAGDESSLDEELPHLSAFAAAPGKPVPASFATLGQANPHEPFFGRQLGDMYQLSLPGLAKPLEFRRVESNGIRPFYLMTHAVSFADFSGVVDGAKAWAQVRLLPWSARPGQVDNRRGPRVWQWSGPANAAKMTTPDLWFTPDDANDFAPRFRASEFNRNTVADAFGGNPTPAHPMQQISAEAALWFAEQCGTRLPSSTEWQAAYAQFGKDVPAGNRGWNLRDQTWDEEKQYLASVSSASGGSTRWMDAEIFVPAGIHVTSGADAHARPAGDGTLLFRPTGSGPGARAFDNLIGNVFVYLCDAPGDLAALADKSPSAMHQFVSDHGNALSVIGGSALSPPDVPIDKPLPLPRSDACYADVGLRLAFSAPPRSRAERVRWALEDQPYLWPAGR